MKLNAFTPIPEDDQELHLPELVYWASLGELSEVQQAVQHDVDVNTTDAEGYSALHAAAENGHLAVVQFLVNQGADTNYKAPYTALELAKMAGHSEIVNYLSKL